jgi:hypothetical protein
MRVALYARVSMDEGWRRHTAFGGFPEHVEV